MRTLLIVIISFFLVCCKRQENKTYMIGGLSTDNLSERRQGVDSLSIDNPVTIDWLININELTSSVDSTNRLGRWLRYYRLSLKQFNQIKQISEIGNRQSSIDYKPGTEDIYKDFYITSQSGSFFLDLDSYSLILNKDANGKFTSDGWDVDTEISLIDIQKKNRKCILFCGSSEIPEEGFWIDDNKFLVLGFTTVEDNCGYPTIWAFDIKRGQKQTIMMTDKDNLKGKDYNTSVRLKIIKFNK